ncbi:MAG: 3-isopropylmalate dehydratase small subunit [Clostridia bacterium]|nr:3-isopropylmalate dehydratase small subunit [Clostridia bacterium]MBQ8784117.1 3-isopropylmalate dehydratase small subunit [Clostridia bacterium]
MLFEGKVIKYGDNVDTDVIIPARYLNTIDKKELAAHCMEDLDATFVNRVEDGDIMVAGYNFGCGSSREHAPIAIKASGISLVIAKSFARIFYRNSINIGLPIIECPEAVDAISEGDKLKADMDAGVIYNLTTGDEYKAEPFPAFIQEIIATGGLIESIKAGKIK